MICLLNKKAAITYAKSNMERPFNDRSTLITGGNPGQNAWLAACLY
jgi:hypothetical protein